MKIRKNKLIRLVLILEHLTWMYYTHTIVEMSAVSI